MNEFLKYCFDPATSTSLWEEAIDKAVTKEMPRAVLAQLCSPEKRAQMYIALRDGTMPIDIPHAAQLPKNEYDEEGRMKYRTVYVNRPEYRVLFTVCNTAMFALFPDWVHKNCTSYQKGLSCAKTVIAISREMETQTGWKSDLSKYFDRVPRSYIDEVFDRIEQRYCHGERDALVEHLREFYHTDLFYADHHHEELVHEYRSLKQGCAVASFLSDVVLYPLDKALSDMDVRYCRYSDDQYCTGREQQRAFDTMRQMLREMQMDINEKKLERLSRKRFFKFLGFSVRGRERSLSAYAIKDFQRMVQNCIRPRKRKNGKWHRPTFDEALRSLINALYNPYGEYSWAQRVLRVINSKDDLDTLNEYCQDALRAAQTGRLDIGGLGYVPDQKDGCISRGKGNNVSSNLRDTPHDIEGWKSIRYMQNALHSSRAAYEMLLTEMVEASINHKP